MAEKSLPKYERLIGKYTGFAHESITVDSTAGGVRLTVATFDPSSGAPARVAFVSAETAQMRYTYDGTTVTSSAGHILDPGETLTLTGYKVINTIRFIRTGVSSGTIKVTYER